MYRSAVLLFLPARTGEEKRGEGKQRASEKGNAFGSIVVEETRHSLLHRMRCLPSERDGGHRTQRHRAVAETVKGTRRKGTAVKKTMTMIRWPLVCAFFVAGRLPPPEAVIVGGPPKTLSRASNRYSPRERGYEGRSLSLVAVAIVFPGEEASQNV